MTDQGFIRRLAETLLRAAEERDETIRVRANQHAESLFTSSNNAYGRVSDGAGTAVSDIPGDTFRLRSASSYLTIAVGNNDPTYGDNALFTPNVGTAANTLAAGNDTRFGGLPAVVTPTADRVPLANGSAVIQPGWLNDHMQRESIPVGATVTIPSGFQMLLADQCDIDGTVDIQGRLVVL